MKYQVTREDGVIEYRIDNNPPENAVILTDEEYEAALNVEV
jgi:hypothetical protein